MMALKNTPAALDKRSCDGFVKSIMNQTDFSDALFARELSKRSVDNISSYNPINT